MGNEKIKVFDLRYSKDKGVLFDYLCEYTFVRLQSMFSYNNLPDTIPQKWLEKYLQRNGQCAIAKDSKGDVYALLGSPGRELDPYYQPTYYVVANPALNFGNTGHSAEFEIGKDCVLARNDYEMVGLTPLVSRYCGLLAENYVTMRISDIVMRSQFLLSAPDNSSYESALTYMKQLEDGNVGVIADNPFFEGVKLQSSTHGSSDYMIQFIELHQYLLGSMYNELGLGATFNMKREAISASELGANDDILMPMIDDMLRQRRIMCDEVNEMFDLDISVDFGSSWHSNIAEKMIVAEGQGIGNSEVVEEFGGEEVKEENDSNMGQEPDDGGNKTVELTQQNGGNNDNGQANTDTRSGIDSNTGAGVDSDVNSENRDNNSQGKESDDRPESDNQRDVSDDNSNEQINGTDSRRSAENSQDNRPDGVGTSGDKDVDSGMDGAGEDKAGKDGEGVDGNRENKEGVELTQQKGDVNVTVEVQIENSGEEEGTGSEDKKDEAEGNSGDKSGERDVPDDGGNDDGNKSDNGEVSDEHGNDDEKSYEDK